ncbi:MAG: hypothetical protein ACOC3V_02660 [bacterium]
MEFYNKYFGKNGYKSEICFVSTHHSRTVSNIYHWVKFTEESGLKDGKYKINYIDVNIDTLVSNNSDIIESIHFKEDGYFSFIKIINDKINPPLNGEIMLLKFDYDLLKYLSYKTYEKTVILDIMHHNKQKYISITPTGNDMVIYNKELKIKDYFKITRLDVGQIRRYLKIKKLKIKQ